jgi:hypothetical protein
MAPTQRPLPVEVVDCIFQDLHPNDFESLKRCSLTCRAFLRHARAYLFRSVTVSVIPDGAVATTPTFLSFLASDPYVASNICNLRIQPNVRHSYSHSQRRWQETANLLNDLRLKLTSVLHLSIHSSFISDWTLEDKDLRMVLIQFWELSTLHHLELHYVTLSRQDLLDLTRVPKLTLVGTRPVADYPWVAVRDISPPRNNENASATGLQDLCIVLRNPEAAEDMYTVVPAASKTLKALRWLASPYHGEPYRLKEPNLTLIHSVDAQDTCLHVIDLHIFPFLTFLALTFPLDGDKSLSNLTALFKRNVGPCALQVVEIFCDYDESQRIPDDSSLNVSSSWEILDQTLMSDVYTALEEVRIGVKECKGLGKSLRVSRNRQNIESNEALALFQRNLPRSYYRGVIVGYKKVVDDF